MDQELKKPIWPRWNPDFLSMWMELRETFRAQIEQSGQRSHAHTEMVETHLLKEFWKWARTADARYRRHQANVSGLDIRVQAIEERLSDLEQRHPS
jgi:hypothetical protein